MDNYRYYIITSRKRVIISSFFSLRLNNWKLLHPCDVNYCNVINVNHVFLLDLASVSNKLSISCWENSNFIDFSWVNNFRKIINNNNIKWILGAVVKYVVVQFLREKLVFWPEFVAFVILYLPRSCLVLMAYSKTNIPCLFLFNIEIFHPR